MQDVGVACAEQLLQTSSPLPANPHIFDFVGPKSYSTLDVKGMLEKISGKTIEVKTIEKDQLQGFFANVFPPSVADSYVEMIHSMLPGGILEGDMQDKSGRQHGPTDLADALQQMYAAA